MSAIGKWTLGKLRRFICIVVNSDCPDGPDPGSFETLTVDPGPSDLNGDVVAGSTCADEFYLSSSLTASCDSLILNDKRIFFGDASGIKPDPDGGAIYHDTGLPYRRLVISSSVDTSFLGGIYGHHIASGAIAGPGSYIGVNGDSLLVLTSSSPDLSGDNIVGTNCSNYFYLSSSLTASCATYLSGVVGIGVPGGYDALLGIAPKLKISNADDGAATVVDMRQHSANADAADIFFYKTRGTETAAAAIEGADQLGMLRFTGLYGGARGEGARIRAGVDLDSGVATTLLKHPGYITMGTTPSGSGLLKRRFIISSNGNVGIGQDWGSPSYTGSIHANLHVSGTTLLGRNCGDFVHLSGALTAACHSLFQGGITATAIASGAIAGPGSYIGVNGDSLLVLTSSQGTPDLGGDITIGTDCTNYLYISSSLTAGCDSYFSGNVGIGIPGGTIAYGDDPQLRISNAYGGASDNLTIVAIEQYTDDEDSADLFMTKTRGSQASPTPVEGGDLIGRIGFLGQIDVTNPVEFGRIVVGADQTVGQGYGSTKAPGFMRFHTTETGSAAATKGSLLIAANGNVGIASRTTDPPYGIDGAFPNANLHVSGTVILGSDCDDFVYISGSLTASCCEHKFLGPVIMEEGTGSACQPPKFYFTKVNPGVYHEISLSGSWLSASTGITHVSGGITQYTASAAYTTISTSGSLTTGSAGIVIIKPGKIGIGTDNPATALQVAGTIRAQEISIVGGAITGSRAIFTETLNVTGAITTAAAIVATGSVRAAGDLYTDQVRRNSSNSTTTKINLDASAQKFYVGDSSDEMIKITSAGLFVEGAMSGSSTLKTAGAITAAGALNVTGTITAAGIASGTIAGPGSYVGLNASNQLVLTASAGGGGSTSPGGSDTQIQYNNGSSFGGVASLTYNDGTGHLNVIDDKKLYFGTGDDASIEYDENGTDRLIISGSTAGIEVTGSILAKDTVTAGGLATNSTSAIKLSSSLDSPGAIQILASAGGIDIDAVGAAAQDINITNTGGSISLKATEDIINAITLDSPNIYFTGGDQDGAYLFYTKPLYLNIIPTIPASTLGKFWNKSGNILCWGGLGFETTGSGHFNKTGADYDFQVQSSNETHKLFVDASADCVGINQSSPDDSVGLDINDDALFTDDKKLYFGTGKETSIEYDEDGSNRLSISGSATGIDVTGSIFATGIASGSIAGPGSYVGLNSNNQLVLTASAGGGGGTDTNEFVITCQGFTYTHSSNTYFRTIPGSAGGIGMWTTAEAGQTDPITIDEQLCGPSGATFIAPAACTITEVRGWIKAGSGADILTAKLYTATGTDGATGTSDALVCTQIGSGATMSAATNGRVYSVSETISSGNSLATGDSLLLAFAAATGNSTQKNYFTITIRGVWS